MANDTKKQEASNGLERLGAQALATVGYVPGLLAGALNDIRTIAELMQYLPELGDRLAAIETKVDSLNKEVVRMREGVDSIDGRVVALNDTLTDELREVTLAVHPLRRLRRGRTSGSGPDAQ